ERLGEGKGPEGTRRPQWVRVRHGSRADLDREEASRIVDGLSVAQRRGRQDEIVSGIRIRVSDRIARRALFIAISKIPLHARAAHKRGWRDRGRERGRPAGRDELAVARHEDRTRTQVEDEERRERGDDDNRHDDQRDEHLPSAGFWGRRRDFWS